MTTNLKEIHENRVIKLEGAYNMRDLGGYETKDGRATKWGRFYRADGLHRLTDSDQRQVLERNVRLIVDLRHSQELEKDPNVFATSEKVSYRHVSLINPATPTVMQVQSLGELYVDMLDKSQIELCEVFEHLSQESEEASLYHCTAGKDRTGVISALLLDNVQVPHETIINDYSLTAELLAPMVDEMRHKHLESADAASIEMFERFMGSAPSNMEMMLEHLYNKYGSGEKYLLSIGLTEEQVAVLKRKLLGE
ncbi:tyrosine-protein phosphatase [Paenibacillus glycanilyticus]|uniref:Protein-tyrosine-phosphatase n=1 Tax=Paenibacillus glycanilyticus TaxID=126569 RepID=A0ABQ6GAW1_9BACL|nr:tyrosine-protein phosphatase [Paenibacillus glycanilyticus]GLX66461.1 protein-tyrosine-phosphatase [Paenibacillus glycanilyticus]